MMSVLWWGGGGRGEWYAFDLCDVCNFLKKGQSCEKVYTRDDAYDNTDDDGDDEDDKQNYVTAILILFTIGNTCDKQCYYCTL